MKKIIYYLSVMWIVFMGLLACDKDDSNPVVELNKATATIDGVEITEFVTVSQQNSLGGYTIQLTDGTIIISIFTNNTELGNYPISSLKSANAENIAIITITQAINVYFASLGTISITAIEGNKITGTFSFEANKYDHCEWKFYQC